jgi:F-type H+-transporting ATPase subunit delta
VRDVTIARNYAEALYSLASDANALDQYGDLIDATAAATSTPSIEAVLMSPRVPKERKVAIMTTALKSAPRPFALFLAAMIKRGRQMLIGRVADEFRAMVDTKLGRVRAGITTARPLDEATRDDLVRRLTAAIGKDVIAGFAVEPAILGGTVVRIGDQIYDGSVRKRLGRLKRQLLTK